MTDTGMDGLFKNQPWIRMQIRSRMGLVMWTGNIHMETERDGYAVYLARSKAPGVCTFRSAHSAAQRMQAHVPPARSQDLDWIGGTVRVASSVW